MLRRELRRTSRTVVDDGNGEQMPVREGGDFVDQVSAVKVWAQAAHDILVELAAAEGVIDPQGLARQVQKRSGVSTTQPASKWIGPLLGIVARQCHANDLPLLTAMVVKRDGTVGQAYDEILRFAKIPAVIGDREEHAAQQRAAAYARWRGAAVAPAPVSATKVVVGRTAKAKAVKAAPARPAKPEPQQGQICPSCFMQMSLTGVCDNCD